MRARLFLCLVALMSGSCTRPSEKIAMPLVPEGPLDCGLQAAIFHKPTRIFGPSRACALPVAHDIALACAGEDFASEGGSKKAGAPERPFPSYEIRDAKCAFSGPDHKRAACVFQYRRAGRGPTWQAGKAHLTYWFSDLSNEIADASYAANWRADAICGAAMASEK